MKKQLITLALLLLCVAAVSAQQVGRPRRVLTLPATPCNPRDFVQAVDTGNTSVCRNNGSAWDAAAGPTASIAAGGADTEVQVNDSGLLAGDPDFTFGPGEFDVTKKRLALGPLGAFGNTAQLRVVNPTVVLGASPSHFSSVMSQFVFKATVPNPLVARGFYGYYATDPTNTVNVGGILGLQGVSDAYGTGTHTIIVGMFGEADNSSSITQPKSVGVWGYSGLYGSGDTTLAIGGEFGSENYGAGTIQNGYGIRIAKPQENGADGPIANLVGLFIDEQLTGTTTNFNLVSKGATSKNKFEGDLILDKLTASTILSLDASKNVASLTIGSGLSFTTGTLSGIDAVADGATKGVAAFAAADFNATTGVIAIDYTNGQAASGSAKGFLAAADYTTFNSKQSGPLTGDVTTSGAAATIANDAVSNAKLANMATATFKGRTTAGTGDPEDLTATQATALLDNVVGDSGSGGTKGLVPAAAAGDAAAGKFLKANGIWTAIASSGITTLNTLTGATQTFATGTAGTDFAVSSSGTTHTFNLPDASAANRGAVTIFAQTFGGEKTFSGASVIFKNTLNRAAFNVNINKLVVASDSQFGFMPGTDANQNAAAVAGLKSSGTSEIEFTDGDTGRGRGRIYGLRVGVISKTANYTLIATDYVVLADATGGAITQTLPACVLGNVGVLYSVIKVDGSANAVTVGRTGSDTINGATSVSLPLQFSTTTVVCGSAGLYYRLSNL